MKPPESRHKNKIMARQKNIEEMTTSEAQKEFGNLLGRLAYTKSYPDAFSLFLDFALLPFNLEPTPEEKERFQKLTDEDKRTLLAMLSCFGIITDNNGEGFKDALGDLFMEHVSHGNNGQFFTPEPLCQFMSLATGVDELKPGQSMCDPTCGSGRMLLAAAKIAAEKGNRNIWLYGSDLDLTCCKMAALNMLVNSMQGEIAHMNTITMDHYQSWHIRKMLSKDGHWLPYFYLTGAGQTDFITRLDISTKRKTFPSKQPAIAPQMSEQRQYKPGEQMMLFNF